MTIQTWRNRPLLVLGVRPSHTQMGVGLGRQAAGDSVGGGGAVGPGSGWGGPASPPPQHWLLPFHPPDLLPSGPRLEPDLESSPAASPGSPSVGSPDASLLCQGFRDQHGGVPAL